MAHGQQQILDAAASTLAAQVTAVAGRVFVDRVDPLQPAELPALLVDESGDGEQVEPTLTGYQRSLGVRVTVCVAHGTTAVAQARELGLEVEQALHADITLGGLASGGISLQASRPAVNGDADRLLALREIDFVCTWYANATTPDLPI